MSGNQSLMLRNVLRPSDSEPVDLRIEGGRIAAVGTQLPQHSGPTDIDCHGGLLLPGFIDSHCHVDKTLWGGPWIPHTAGPSVAERIADERVRRLDVGYPAPNRITALLEQMSQCGTTSIRTHTDVDPEVGLSAIAAVQESANAMAGRIDVQQVAFPQQGVVTRPGTASLLKDALDMGATAIGGVDPAGFDGDPNGQLDAIFNIAGNAGCDIDIHLHDPGELGIWQVEKIIERTKGMGMGGRVTISHAFCLGDMSAPVQSRVFDGLAEARISLTTAAVFSRPVLPLRVLAEQGITVGCGNDGIRDLWSPYGNGDMLERAMFVAYRGDLRRDEDIASALDTATYNGARILGLEGYGLDVGCTADLVVVPARNVAEAVVSRPQRSLVLKSGRVVVDRFTPVA
ncbi:MAG: amidohydrolase family protein [Actinomycetes bacterium]